MGSHRQPGVVLTKPHRVSPKQRSAPNYFDMIRDMADHEDQDFLELIDRAEDERPSHELPAADEDPLPCQQTSGA